MNEIERARVFTRVFPALINSKTIKEAASEADIGERTLRRHLKDPKFITAFCDYSSQIRYMIAAQVADAQQRAIDTIVELLNAESENVRLRAALELLNINNSLMNEIEFDARIRFLEGEIQKLPELE